MTEDKNVETPVSDAPAPVDESARMAEVFDKGTEAAAHEDGLPVVETEEEEAPAVADEPAAEEEPAPGVVTDPEAEPEVPAVLTDEEQDAADAKELGFKNQRASNEFKAMRKELRDLRPLREAVEKYEKPAEHWNTLEGFLKEKEITPDQFRSAVLMVASINSQDLPALRQTRDSLMAEVANLNARLGESGHGYDPLAAQGNHDLAQAVENGEITPERAAELARARHEANHYRGIQERQVQQTQQTQAQQQAEAVARSELDTIGEEYRAMDARFDEKIAVLTPILRSVLPDLPPAKWAAKFKEAYRNVALPAAAAPVAPARTPLRNQPLRASALPPAGAASVVSSPDDIMAEALKAAAAMDGVPYRA